MKRSLRIGFVHPQLGVGGSERLVLDAASCLQQAGHRVTIFTSRHDREDSLHDARDGSVEVRVYGDFLPLDIADRMLAPFNIGRTCYAALRLAMSREHFDVIFADLVSQSIPMLRLMTRAKIIFYCHFPDRLLASQLGGLYRWYRAPIDWSERVSIGMAHLVVANSRFTASIMGRTFPRLGPPRLLYPGVDVASFANNGRAAHDGSIMLLAISRYDRRKNTGLAIEALAALEARAAGRNLPPCTIGDCRRLRRPKPPEPRSPARTSCADGPACADWQGGLSALARRRADCATFFRAVDAWFIPRSMSISATCRWKRWRLRGR